MREFQRDWSTLPDKKVGFSILGEVISLILVIGIPSKLEGVPGFSEKSPTLKRYIYISTEPISIIFGFLESTISNSFISGVL